MADGIILLRAQPLTDEEAANLPPLIKSGDDREQKLEGIVAGWTRASSKTDPQKHIDAGGFLLHDVALVDANRTPPEPIDLGALLRAVEHRLRGAPTPTISDPCPNRHIILVRCRVDKCDCHDVHIRPRLTCRASSFGDGASFLGSKFGDGADFGRSTFGDMVSFVGSKSGNEASFDESTLGDEARFDGSRFGDRAIFSGSTFGEGAGFTRATFGNEAGFAGSKFGNAASFDESAFGVGAVFDRSSFGSGATFGASKFGGGAGFDYTTFGHKAYFDQSKFGDGASFQRATFGDRPTFHESTFGDDVSFAGSKFGHQASFYKSKFGEEADFTGSEFGREACFRSSVFGDRASFNGSKFEEGANFVSSKFGVGALFNRATFGDGASFRESKFGDGAEFNHVALPGADLAHVSLKGVSIEDARFPNADLRHVENLLLSGQDIRGARFAIQAKDPWSILRRKYTGPAFLFHVMLLMAFVGGYAAKAAMWIAVNRVQTVGLQATEQLHGTATQAAEAMHDDAQKTATSHPHVADAVEKVGEKVGERFDETISKLPQSVAPTGDEPEYSVFEVLLSGDGPLWMTLLAIALLGYNGERYIVTRHVAELRDEEERSGFAPDWIARPPPITGPSSKASWRKPIQLCRRWRELFNAQQAGYHWAYRRHCYVLRPLVVVAIVAFGFHLVKWLCLPVYLS